MMNVIRALLNSKKFLTMITTMIVVLIGKIGFDIDEETIKYLVGLGATTILGFGMADFGKEGTKINAATVVEVADKDRQ